MDPLKFADEATFVTRVVGLLSSLVGLVVVASLIGLVNNSIDQRIEELRKGRSPVIASEHTILLNFDLERVLAILSQMQSHDRRVSTKRTYVILSSVEKEEVEDSIYHAFPGARDIDLVVRHGDTGDYKSLELCGATRATKIIILNPNLNKTTAASQSNIVDMPVIRSLLALRRFNQLKASVVCEASNRDRVPLLMHLGGGDSLQCVVMDEVLSRVLVQSARTPQLAEIYENLLEKSATGIFVFRKK